MFDVEKFRLEMIRDRALISVRVDYRQYLMLMTLAWAWQQEGRDDYGTRERAIEKRQQAQNSAWTLTGRWPIRTASAMAEALANQEA